MPNRIEITGNVGNAPVLKHVDTTKGRKQVTGFSIFADEYRRDDAGELEQTGGFWARVAVWEPHAGRVARLLQKGTRVTVIGTLRVTRWDNEQDEEQTGLDVIADKVTLELGRIENVTFRRREGCTDPDPQHNERSSPGTLAGDPSDDL